MTRRLALLAGVHAAYAGIGGRTILIWEAA